jgi:hypothetical protein
VGLERSASGGQWSVNGGPWQLLLPAMDEFMRACGLAPVSEVTEPVGLPTR